MNGYENGKIYRLTCNGLVYYGSTNQTLTERLYTHKSPRARCSSRLLFGLGEVEIELVENYPCNNKRELEEREQYFIDNFECINKQNAFTTLEERKEYMKTFLKDYYIENQDKLIERSKLFYDTNKEDILKKQSEWYQLNKERISKQRKERYDANKEKINEKRRMKAIKNRIKTIP